MYSTGEINKKSLIEDCLLQGLGGQTSSDKAAVARPLLVSSATCVVFHRGMSKKSPIEECLLQGLAGEASSDKAVVAGPCL